MVKDIKKLRFLRDVLPHEFLVLRDGRKVKNIYELSHNLRIMHNDIFGYHVSFKRNDFSEWINKIIGDKILAKKIEKIKDKNEMAQIIIDRVHEIEREMIKENKLKNKISSKPNKEKVNKKNDFKINKIKKVDKKQVKDNKSNLKRELIEDNQKKEYESKLDALLNREKFIIEKEREITFREKKIQEIEERIENKLKEISENARKNKSKDFLIGIIVGILLMVLGIIIYWKLTI